MKLSRTVNIDTTTWIISPLGKHSVPFFGHCVAVHNFWCHCKVHYFRSTFFVRKLRSDNKMTTSSKWTIKIGNWRVPGSCFGHFQWSNMDLESYLPIPWPGSSCCCSCGQKVSLRSACRACSVQPALHRHHRLPNWIQDGVGSANYPESEVQWWFGTMEFYDFPFSWEWNNHPNWRTPSFFRGVGQPPTSL